MWRRMRKRRRRRRRRSECPRQFYLERNAKERRAKTGERGHDAALDQRLVRFIGRTQRRDGERGRGRASERGRGR